MKRYFEGQDLFVTKEMDYGKTLAESLETGDYLDMTKNEIKALKQIERPVKREVKMTGEIKGVPFLAFLDGLAEDGRILEYKTGKTPWDLKRVREAEQAKFYPLIRFLETGKPAEIIFFWIQTQDGESGIEATGEVKKLSFFPTEDGLDRYADEVVGVANEIADAWEEWKKESPEKDVCELRIGEYFEIQKKIDELKETQDSIKQNLELEMQKQIKIEHPSGTVYWTKRKSVIVPDDKKEEIDVLKKEIKEIEATCETEEKKILSFRKK